jgi:hypothetical protein
MKLIDRLSKKDLVGLIGKCWMTHDGMWFAHSFFSHGIEATNRTNKAAIAALAPIEIKRFMKGLNVTKEDLQTFPALRDFFGDVGDLVIPDFMNVEFAFVEPDIMRWAFNEKGCFAFNGISMLGAIDGYECGVFYRIRCWLDALGIAYEMSPDVDLCVMPTRGKCEGEFILQLPETKSTT